MFSVEIGDKLQLYSCTNKKYISRENVRANLLMLGTSLAKQTRMVIDRDVITTKNILCIVILRGGGILYPGFISEYLEADFCMMTLKRDDKTADSVCCVHKSNVRRSFYDLAIYIDCVSATGRTIRKAYEIINDQCQVSHNVASIICGSQSATRLLNESGIGVIGFSLNEMLTGNLVTPDFGELDAGDLFASTCA